VTKEATAQGGHCMKKGEKHSLHFTNKKKKGEKLEEKGSPSYERKESNSKEICINKEKEKEKVASDGTSTKKKESGSWRSISSRNGDSDLGLCIE